MAKIYLYFSTLRLCFSYSLELLFEEYQNALTISWVIDWQFDLCGISRNGPCIDGIIDTF